MNKTIGIIGGDGRNVELAKAFYKEGVKVGTYSIYDERLKELKIDTVDELLEKSDVIVTGIPCMKDRDLLNSEDKISFTYLFNKMNEKQIFFGGIIKENIYEIAGKKGIKCYDFMEAEEFAILNAIPTSEGAIEIAIREMKTTLHASNVLVLGFGRIGKVLAKMLTGIGAEVFVTARKESDFAWIRAYGYKKLEYEELDKDIGKFDVIFNTVPQMLIDERRLTLLKQDCLIIDLASKPGGVDFEKAKEMNLKVEWALGLPGKIAPATAAQYMKELIINKIKLCADNSI